MTIGSGYEGTLTRAPSHDDVPRHIQEEEQMGILDPWLPVLRARTTRCSSSSVR